MFDRKKFFDLTRRSPFGGSLSQQQVDGLENLLTVWEKSYGQNPYRWLAYMLATAYHETARTMQPIAEYGKGRGRPYGIPDPTTKQTYYGRGYVQLTWLENYRRASAELGVDFVNQPDLAMKPNHAAEILYRGSIEGWFTKKTLADYFSDAKSDPVGARRIINGTDRADLIAGYYRNFLAALDASFVDQPVTRDPLATLTSKQRQWLAAEINAGRIKIPA